MAEKICTVRKIGSSNSDMDVVAVNTDWTADKAYDYVFVCAVRGRTPTFVYTGSGTVTEIADLGEAGGQYTKVYKVTNVNSGDFFDNYYKMVVIA